MAPDESRTWPATVFILQRVWLCTSYSLGLNLLLDRKIQYIHFFQFSYCIPLSLCPGCAVECWMSATSWTTKWNWGWEQVRAARPHTVWLRLLHYEKVADNLLLIIFVFFKTFGLRNICQPVSHTVAFKQLVLILADSISSDSSHVEKPCLFSTSSILIQQADESSNISLTCC